MAILTTTTASSSSPTPQMRNFKLSKKWSLARIIKNSTIRKATLDYCGLSFTRMPTTIGVCFFWYFSVNYYIPLHQSHSFPAKWRLSWIFKSQNNTNEPVNRRLWYFIACNISFFRYVHKGNSADTYITTTLPWTISLHHSILPLQRRRLCPTISRDSFQTLNKSNFHTVSTLLSTTVQSLSTEPHPSSTVHSPQCHVPHATFNLGTGQTNPVTVKLHNWIKSCVNVVSTNDISQLFNNTIQQQPQHQITSRPRTTTFCVHFTSSPGYHCNYHYKHRAIRVLIQQWN